MSSRVCRGGRQLGGRASSRHGGGGRQEGGLCVLQQRVRTVLVQAAQDGVHVRAPLRVNVHGGRLRVLLLRSVRRRGVPLALVLPCGVGGPQRGVLRVLLGLGPRRLLQPVDLLVQLGVEEVAAAQAGEHLCGLRV